MTLEDEVQTEFTHYEQAKKWADRADTVLENTQGKIGATPESRTLDYQKATSYALTSLAFSSMLSSGFTS